MTADIASAEEAGEARADAPSPDVRLHLIVAAVFLVLSVVGIAFTSLQLVFPELGSGVAYTSYGRLRPVAWNLFLYGWLTIGLLGAAHHVVGRLAGTQSTRRVLPLASLLFVAGGVAAGSVAVALGMSEGRLHLEMPLWADGVILLGLLLAAVSITRVAAGGEGRLGPPTWYLVAGVWWLPLAWVAGNFPGIAGFSGAIQTSFYRASVTGLWFVAAGVGVVYYLIPRLVGADPARHSRLATLAFWSLAIAWAGTGARDFIYGAGPDWFETFGVAFSIALVVPVLAIVTDLGMAMRGRWEAVTDRMTLRYVVAGAFLFVLVPMANLVTTLRTSSAVVQFSSWVAANDHLVFAGAATFWLFAVAHHLFGQGSASGERVGRWHLGLSVGGLGVALGAMWMGGLVAGFTWAAGANDGVPNGFGGGFTSTVTGQQAYLVVRAVGLVVFALAQVLFLVMAVRRPGEPVADGPATEEAAEVDFAGSPTEIGWRGLRFGAVALFAAAAVVAWLLPSLDPANAEATILGDTSRVYPEGSPETTGRAVYLAEGCWYCHTQEVRGIVTDAGLGPVAIAGDYAHEVPVLRGVERIGPDLMHAGSREEAGSAVFVSAHLQDPRANRAWSSMPSYAYLSEADLDALTAYLVGLK